MFALYIVLTRFDAETVDGSNTVSHMEHMYKYNVCSLHYKGMVGLQMNACSTAVEILGKN